ncbi:hypothetical protein [Streptomyces sp. WMMC897]|uniref:hypothetical protein n=1 Tax=Streptomyces sp. WMMC897 TaxID=3014782 RepID=UPI0022B617B2|nr:hypothetical protein [Streptomyces sp. WMMC897]MCZ7416667.1 hypothetical protein [Streptomyces sp. WMMC897]
MKTAIRATAAVAALVLGITGCGSGDDDTSAGGEQTPASSPQPDPTVEKSVGTELERKDAQEVMRLSEEAMTQAESMRVKGTVDLDGVETEMEIALDKGGSCEGRMSQPTGGFEFIGVEGHGYMKADEKFWRANSEESQEVEDIMVDLFADRWVDMGEDEDISGFCDLGELMGDTSDAGSDPSATKGEKKQHEGVEVIPVTTKEEGETTTGLVANDDDAPYILEMTNETEDGTVEKMTFSDFDKPIEVTAPADAVDLNDLAGGAEA